MKRFVLVLSISATIFAGIYGLAASLGVSSNTLGAGNATVAACQAGSLTVSYAPTYTTGGTAGYKATTVTVGGIDTSASACGNKPIKVTLTGPGSSNASLAEQTGTTPTSGSSMDFTFSSVNASDVTGVHVTITG